MPPILNRQAASKPESNTGHICIDNVYTALYSPGSLGETITMSQNTARRVRKDDVIQIRASVEMKSVLNRAAALRGQKLSEFMLESARRSAEETLLDQRAFFLDDRAHAKFLGLLDAPPAPSKQLCERMTRKPAWER
jgi:uncharacterized protein (DUF1778 family)